MTFKEFVQVYRKQRNWPTCDIQLLALDPGETTGWAAGKQSMLQASGQVDTKEFPEVVESLTKLFDMVKPKHIICEDYRVYAYKSDDHKWSKVQTIRVIGAILTLACQRGIPVSFELAQQPKTFVTDDKLKMWKFYVKGQRHARDAIRHFCYYSIFDNPEK